MGNILTRFVCYDREDRSCCDFNNIFNCSFRRKKRQYNYNNQNNYNIDLRQLEHPNMYVEASSASLSKNIVGIRV